MHAYALVSITAVGGRQEKETLAVPEVVEQMHPFPQPKLQKIVNHAQNEGANPALTIPRTVWIHELPACCAGSSSIARPHHNERFHSQLHAESRFAAYMTQASASDQYVHIHV